MKNKFAIGALVSVLVQVLSIVIQQVSQREISGFSPIIGIAIITSIVLAIVAIKKYSKDNSIGGFGIATVSLILSSMLGGVFVFAYALFFSIAQS